MPEVFDKNGYATGMFGKWHLGDAYPYLPLHHGYDEAVFHRGEVVGQTPDCWNKDYFDDRYFRNGVPEKYEAYKVGVPGHEEVTITCHDLHTSGSIAWNHSQIRKPGNQHLSEGYFMIDVYESGTYQVSLRRWPKESGLAFDEAPQQLGEDKPWYQSKPEGTVLQLKKAAVEVGGLLKEKPVDMSAREVTFQAKLSKGRQHFKPYFVTEAGKEFGAFYVYIEPAK